MRRFLLLAVLIPGACKTSKVEVVNEPLAPFAEDVEFLKRYADCVVLESPDGGVVAVSPLLSGRVMTSAFRADETGFGLVNRPAIVEGPLERGFPNYGGEDRLWVAPEGGQFGLYFDPGDPQIADNWFVPAEMDGAPRGVAGRTEGTIIFRNRMRLINASGTPQRLEVERRVRVLDRNQVSTLVGATLGEDVRCVAFESTNKLRSLSRTAVPHDRALAAVWILGQFKPSPSTFVLVPFNTGGDDPPVKDDYFGVVPVERLTLLDHGSHGTARFQADGQLRSKIGVNAQAATGWLGSFDPARSVLTLVHHSVAAADARIPACDWINPNPTPYSGDVATSYNNSPDLPFYELESLSAALPEEPGSTVNHMHTTIHLDGDRAVLLELAQRLLGYSLELPPD